MSAPLSTLELLRWAAGKPSGSTQEDLAALCARVDVMHTVRDVLRSGTPAEKMTALRALRELATPDAFGLARLALHDEAAPVRAMAARALARSRDDTDWQGLQEALNAAEPSVQLAVMDSLARMDPAAAGALFRERFERAPEEEKRSALATAQRLRLPEAESLARLGLASSEATTRAAAVALLAREGEATDGLLVQALMDAADVVRLEALRALSRRPRVPASVFVPLLSAASTAQVREQALQALVLRGDASACDPVVRLLEAPESSLRRRAILATGELGCIGATDSLLEMLARTRDEDERADLVTALGRLGGHEAWEALRKELSGAAPRVRRAAVSAWASDAAPQDATPVLMARLRDEPDAEVRMAIALALANSSQQVGHRALLLALEDAAPEVRRMAVRTLGRDASPEALQALRAHQATERDSAVLRELATALEQQQGAAENLTQAASPAERHLFDPARTGQSVAEWLTSPERHPATERVYFYEGGHLEHLDTASRLHVFQYTAIGDHLHIRPEGAPERSTAFTVTPAPPASNDVPRSFRLELTRDVLTGADAPRTLYFRQPTEADSGRGDSH
ncbi:HEAT repeat domain-containing protein [Myxococcus sp. SDU36]|uniref:HEAT repeat domain-containing protein n=1 Tax=Myxococcus sp. SDU36 TaxID=2831967 RepID=UPI0025437AEF|nr:HEAT repeat domain-containing protein [Myxococcus sp. SDU36]WIG98622.1 HEAT repeat domain-containing protein [Myxococcus sp. SDU36]